MTGTAEEQAVNLPWRHRRLCPIDLPAETVLQQKGQPSVSTRQPQVRLLVRPPGAARPRSQSVLSPTSGAAPQFSYSEGEGRRLAHHQSIVDPLVRRGLGCRRLRGLPC
jgi:hypothetical protein